MSIIIFSDIFGRNFQSSLDAFTKEFIIKQIFALMRKESYCYVKDCENESDFKVVAIKKNTDFQVFLYLCAYHMNEIFWENPYGDP